MRVMCFNRLIPYSKQIGGFEYTTFFNPGERYILDDEIFGQIEELHPHLIYTSSLLDPYLNKKLPTNWKGKKVLFYRNRGMGDALIATCLPHYFNVQLGAECFQMAHRFNEFIWRGNPYLTGGCSLSWPLHFDAVYRKDDSKPFFDHSFFFENVSEWDNEQQQENVYDRMFRTCGIDPGTVSPKYKRPVLGLAPDDIQKRRELLLNIGSHINKDLSKGYILYQLKATNAGRTVPLMKAKEILTSLSSLDIPIFVTGEENLKADENDLLFDGTHSAMSIIGMTATPREYVALVETASLIVGPDSFGLHVAAAFETPAVGLWGPFSPDSRVKYYTRQAHVFKPAACPHAPCFNYRETLPISKCPNGPAQTSCEVLRAITGEEVLAAAKSVL